MRGHIRLPAVVLPFVLLLSACALQPLREPAGANPPNRLGESRMQGSLLRRYSLEEAVAESDLIVDVSVTGWLEDHENRLQTFFEVEVEDTFKGDELERFVLVQDGSTSRTFDFYPLFQVGNRLMLFLKGPVEQFEGHENVCFTIGGHPTVLYITELDGSSYVQDRFGALTEAPVAQGQMTPVGSPEHLAVCEAALLEDELHVDPVNILRYEDFTGYVLERSDLTAEVDS